MKFEYFRSEWGNRPSLDWIENAGGQTHTLLESEYKTSTNEDYKEVQLRVNAYMRAPASTCEDLESQTRTNLEVLQEFGDILDWKCKRRARWESDYQDELDSLQPCDVLEELMMGPLHYWLEWKEDIQYKDLVKMSTGLNSILAISADPERLLAGNLPLPRCFIFYSNYSIAQSCS